MKKTIVITGGAGFLGTHLSTALLNKGYKIYSIDRYPSPLSRVDSCISSFSDRETIVPIISNALIVIHLAAIVGVDMCRTQPELVRQVNDLETRAFIDLCKQSGVKRFIFSSSSEVYGNSRQTPYVETAVPSAISLYGELKVSIEQYLQSVASNDFTVGIPRLFNMYGPGQRNAFVIPLFIQAALNHQPLRVLGDGNQRRCFTYVQDSVDGIVSLIEYDSMYDIVNIGSDTETNVNELAALILRSVPHSHSSIMHVPYGKDGEREQSLEVIRRVPSINKAKKILGFKPKIDLSTGILGVVTFLSQHTETEL